MNRKKIILKTSVILFIAKIITAVLSFVTRNAFIYGVGIDYLGLNGVIADVLAMLSLAELGFQSAIVYRLYKPIAENDYNTINQILAIFRKIYKIIGCIIFIGGLFLVPLLKHIITDVDISWDIIYIAYILYILSTSITYFMAYRRAFLYANQEQYVITLIDTLLLVVFGLLKIAALALAKNYILFVALCLLQNVLSNIVINLFTVKTHTWINEKKTEKNKTLGKKIIADTKNVFAGKIAGYIYSSTDNLVISALISTKTIGYVGNYKTIFVTINTLLTGLFQPFQPMIGNYLISKRREEAFSLFDNYSFLRYTVVLFILNPTLVLADVFIKMWLGEEYLMSGGIIYLLFFDIYISIVHGTTGEFVEALGYFKDAKKVYFCGALVNLSGSIIGAKLFGLEGVFGATVLSQMIMWFGRSHIVFSKYFMNYKAYIRYWIKQAIFFINFILVNGISTLAFRKITFIQSNILLFIIGGAACVMVSALDLVLFFHKMPEFVYVWNIMKETLVKITGKIRPESEK